MHLAFALIVAAPLLYAAASKLLDPSRFARAIPRFGLSFFQPGPTSARLVGGLELGVGAALVASPEVATAVCASALYFAFSFLMLRARLRGSSGDCGCFGTLNSAIDAASIARNVVLAIACLLIAYLRTQGALFPAYDTRTAVALVVTFTIGAAATDTFLSIRRRPA